MPDPASPARRAVLLAWDAADWKVINPLLDTGRMPHLAGVIDRGVMGGLAAFAPLDPALLWTSAATGMTPDRHGVLGSHEPDPVTGGARPAASTTRKVKAVWNILNQSGLRAHVFGWPASHPAEPLAQIDQQKDRRLIELADNLAETISLHAAATWAMERHPWDFAAVHYPATARAGRAFMQFCPPKMDRVSEADFLVYKDVVEGIYRFQDMMLGRILELAGPDAAIMIVSAHGFHSGSLRPPAETGNEAWHRSQGVFVMAGPGLRCDELIFGAGVLDIAPTVLSLFGLPPAEDMPGRPLVEAFEQPPARERIPSWEAVAGPSGMHARESCGEVESARAAIEELAGLGYRDSISPEARQMAAAAENSRQFNLARFYMGAGQPARALPILEALPLEGDNAAIRLRLAHCCYLTQRLERCRELIGPLLDPAKNAPLANMLDGALLLAEGKPEAGLARLRAAERLMQSDPGMACFIGGIYINARRWPDAERAFRLALDMEPDLAQGFEGLAKALLAMNRFAEAAEAALDAIRIDFHLPSAHFVLGQASARLGYADRSRQAFEIARAFGAPGANREGMTIRPPRESEWPACRMLLPEAFRRGRRPEFLLALDDAAPRIVGAASFCRYADTMHSVQVHVPRPLRRRSIGSALLARLKSEARQAGDRKMAAQVEVERDPETAAFLLARGFRRTESLISVEADLALVLPVLRALSDRLAGPRKMPAQASIEPLRPAHTEAVLRLYEELILEDPGAHAALFRTARDIERFRHSHVLVVNGRVEGMLLVELEGAVANLRGLALSPRYRRNWATALLLAAGAESAIPAGARCTRFQYLEANRNTALLARRFEAKRLGVLARFVCEISGL